MDVARREATRKDALYLYMGPEECSVCYEPLNGKRVWAHKNKEDGPGCDHPIDEICRSQLLEDSHGWPIQCPDCRVFRVVNTGPLEIPEELPKLFGGNADEIPEKLANFMKLRREQIFDAGLYKGAFVLSTAFIISMIFVKYMNHQPRHPYRITPTEQLTNLATMVIQIAPVAWMFFLNFINPDHTDSDSLEFKLHRTVAKIHNKEMGTSYTRGLVLGMALILGITLYLAPNETNLTHGPETKLSDLLVQLGLPVGGMAFCAYVIPLLMTKMFGEIDH